MSRDNSGYCGHYSNLSSFSLDPVDIPVCISRNPFRYNIESCKPCVKTSGAAGNAHEQSLRYADSSRDGYVPNELLQRSILEDIRASNFNNFASSSSSVVGVKFLENNYLIHPTGKHLDTLSVKNTSNVSKPGFTLKVSSGMPLHQVHCVSGASCLVSQPQLLCRSTYDVFHARMVSSDELEPRLQRRCESGALLDPVQKWRLPSVIADMSVSSTSSGRASILCANGQLFQWSPRGGLRSCSGGRSVIPQLHHDTINSTQPIASMRVECSLHPQVCYLLFNEQLLLYDNREAGKAGLLFSNNNSISTSSSGSSGSSSVIDSVSQFRCDGNRLLVSGGGYSLILDSRYTRSPLQKRPLPFAQSMIARVQGPPWLSGNQELFLGANESSAQILSHSIESNNDSSSSSSSGASLRLLSAATAFGSSSSYYRWDCSAFPVITSRGSRLSSASGTSLSEAVTLTGFDLIPCDSGNSSSSSSNGGGGGLNSCLLVHQTSLGDVFSQRVTWSSNQAAERLLRRSITNTSSSSGGNTGSGSLSQHITTPAKAAPPSDLKSLIGSFGAVNSGSNSGAAAAAAATQTLSVPGVTTAAAAGSASSSVSVIQLNTPCGVRTATTNNTNSSSTNNLYPRASSCFALHQPQSGLLAFDVLTFHPARVRLDLAKTLVTTTTAAAAVGSMVSEEEMEEVEAALLPLLEDLVERATQGPLTLLEVQRLIRCSDGSSGRGEQVSLPALRLYLTSSSGALSADLCEVLVPLPAALKTVSACCCCSCYQNAVKAARKGPTASNLSGGRSALFAAISGSSGGSAGADSDDSVVVCGAVGCPMAYLYCYRRRIHTSNTGSISGPASRSIAAGLTGRSTNNPSSSSTATAATMGCIYKPNLVIQQQQQQQQLTQADSQEVDMFLTQQSQAMMSPLAVAIGGPSTAAAAAAGMSQATVFTHQSILNTQNSLMPPPTTSSRLKKTRSNSVTSELINSLSASWDSLSIH